MRQIRVIVLFREPRYVGDLQIEGGYQHHYIIRDTACHDEKLIEIYRE